MKKLIAFVALAGLLAAGCASQDNQGGSLDNAKYGTGNGPETINTNSPATNSNSNLHINTTPKSSDSTLDPKNQNP